jgi:nucleoid-associated protein YgaU
MRTGRFKKLAIAIAILIIGIGTAFVFRREHPVESSGAAVSPEPALRRAANQTAQPKPQAEPALAGRIEPYTPPAPTDVDRADSADVVSSLDNPEPQTGSPLKWQTVRRPAESFGALSSDPQRTPADRFTAESPTMVRQPTPLVRHKIVDGDTLAALARRYLGPEQGWHDLFEYNRDVLVTPELLPIGRELRIPPRDFMPPQAPTAEFQSPGLTTVAEPVSTARQPTAAQFAPSVPTRKTTERPSAKTYVVQRHDTLPLIARKLYGDISRQRELLEANAGQLRSAKDLRPGMTLVVPAAPQVGPPYDGLPRPSK